jgi:thiosulfate/3-mercaptopyruvate sulfurtransferase
VFQALLPLLVEPAELDAKLDAPNLLIVDLNRAEVYAQSHLPHAVWLDYAAITAANPPAMGLLPDAATLTTVLRAIGLRRDTHVVAYDSEGNSRAARLLWTLEAVGHRHYSLLNGGLAAWQQEGRRLSMEAVKPAPGDFTVTLNSEAIADKHWIAEHLKDPQVLLLDARTAEEYDGSLVRSARGGHIPGAVNYDYSNAIDRANALRLKPAPVLRQALMEKGVTPEREVVLYCQTHHRSAHTWFVLKLLGFGKVRGYPGSWSEWGNDPSLPVERNPS